MSLYIQTLLKNALGYIKSGELDEALNLIRRAQDSSPNNPDIFRLLSVISALKFDYNNALELIDESIRLDSRNGVALSNKGNILKELGRHDEAILCFDEAIRLLPNYSEAYNNKANALQDLQRYEEAIDWYDKAIALQPMYAEAYSNKGNALEWLRRHDEAMENYDKATAINPQYVDSYWHKALSQLASGNFELGWQNYEARWSKVNPIQFLYAQITRLESLQNIDGKNILIWAEQGLGDTLQFCRYIKILAHHGAKITFVIPKALMEVLKPLSGYCSMVNASEEISLSFDFQSPLLSLPILFGTTVNTVPNTTPYLTPEPKKVESFAAIIRNSNRLKVGLVWNGGFRADHPELWDTNKRRNIDLALIAQLKDIPGIDFYSLQKGDPAESELIAKKSVLWPHIIDNSSLLKDFSDTAALIENLDLVISVDTSTAHLAGALGKPVWMLNRYDSCWRWLRDREDSPWYPTAKIYQQKQPGSWDEVIARVRLDLNGLAQKKHTGV